MECVGHLNEHDVVQYLTYEIPGAEASDTDSEPGNQEESGFLSGTFGIRSRYEGSRGEESEEDLISKTYGGLNALEVAVIAEAKYFLSQKSVQRVVDGM